MGWLGLGWSGIDRRWDLLAYGYGNVDRIEKGNRRQWSGDSPFMD
jgi:hypothetical protein